jgi:uncharacterized protein YyaL (SSP411 family)
MQSQMTFIADLRSALGLLRVFLLSLLLAPAWAGMQNQLKGHPSPYLAMHGDDPVAWQDWGEAALELAREQDKLLFISSGYFSCHWCHVMQRESYRNPQVAALLNEHFIPVKLDRELHPALDAYLIDYLERTQGTAGWPLNIFLTPEGYPLIGATYLPVDQFSTLLQRLNKTWNDKRGKTRNLARRALLQVIAKKVHGQAKSLLPGELRQRFVLQALSFGDAMEGGFGDQNKFPMAPQLLGLLAIRSDVPYPPLDSLLQLTLDQMLQQGLRDHLAGGFFRYAVDPSWQVPHFEKMLYTQAQLARVFLLAGVSYGREDYLEIARETLDFMLREMPGEQGALIASFSAIDEKGEEGGPYLWHPQDLDTLLGAEDAALVRRYWAMVGPPPLESGYLPRRGASIEELAAASQQSPEYVWSDLQELREKLLEARRQRALPADNKELAAWNGLAVGTLAMAAKLLNQPTYGAAANKIAKALHSRLWQDGELWRARAGDAAVGATGLADYAYLAEGLHLLLQLQHDDEIAMWRDQLIDTAWDKFFSEQGWQATQQHLIPGMGAKMADGDGALRSPSAVLMALTKSVGSADFKNRLEAAIAMSRDSVQAEPFWHASYVPVLISAE